MTNQAKKRYPKLSELSINIVEHLVESVIGERAVKEIKSPLLDKKLQESMIEALTSTEKRFLNGHDDKEFCIALLSLPIIDLPSTAQNIRAFYNDPSSDSFSRYLKNRFSSDFPNISIERIEAGSTFYISILREEMVNVSEEIRDKLHTISSLRIEHNINQIAESVQAMLALFLSDDATDTLSTSVDNAKGPLFRLSKQENDSVVREFESRAHVISIGRSPTSDIVLDDLVVSWHHGYIERVTGNFLFHHQSTTNPTTIRRRGRDYQLSNEGKRDFILENGDRVNIGKHIFIVEFEVLPHSKGYKTTQKNG
mgnify:CR=1 FL=1